MNKLFILFIFNLLLAQPESRFDTFDWTLYRQTGSINSISEGYNYTYIATGNAGILRWHLYQNRFDKPITTAQGLTGNEVLAVHFDKNTSILWAATEENLNYSYNGAGNWFSIKLEDTGLHRNALIEQIGSSDNFVWVNTGNNFLKLDKVSGIVMGLQPLPDENNIIWSSKKERLFEIPNQLKYFTIMEGWIANFNELIDPFGRVVLPTTFFYGSNSVVYLGLEDGTVFIGDSQMEIFYPNYFNLNNTDISAFTKSDNVWIIGRDNFSSEGITKYHSRNNEFQHIDFEQEINFNQKSFFSILETDKEIWLGGNSILSIYNKKEDFWREIGEANGLPNAIILSMIEDTSSIWVGTTKGLVKLSKKTKRTETIDLLNVFKLHNINDLHIVNDELWIATDYSLFIFDIKNKLISNFKKYGNTINIDKMKDALTNFSDLYEYRNNIYITTPFGILKYDKFDEQWSMAVEPSAYTGSIVNRITIDDNYCFIGTDSGIWQVNLEDGSSQLFDYHFIGSVQDLYIQDDTLLIGSNNGLIKYFWKKNL